MSWIRCIDQMPTAVDARSCGLSKVPCVRVVHKNGVEHDLSWDLVSAEHHIAWCRLMPAYHELEVLT